jgi:hypothetical protein
MIVRTKGGNFQTGNASVLLEFLGVKTEAAGIHKVAGDVELIASVPFHLKKILKLKRGCLLFLTE